MPASSDSPTVRSLPRWESAALWLVVLLLVLRPLTSIELWWELARGRAVVAGSVSPSADLLIAETSADADWLGGVPFYFLWSFSGVLGLAFFPVLAAAVILAGWRTSRSMSASGWPALASILLFFWIARVGLQPVPRLFDLLGILGLTRLLSRTDSRLPRLVLTAIWFAVWMNFAPGPVWGLMMLACFARERCGPLLMSAVLGGLCSPRGAWGWWDALVRFAPAVFANVDPTHGNADWPTIWQPLNGGTITIAALFWGLIVAQRWPFRRSISEVCRWLVPVAAVVMNPLHLASAAVWMLCCLSWDAPQHKLNESNVSRSPRDAVLWRRVVLVGALLLAVADGFGWFGISQQRLGWGIAHEIDPRLLDATLLYDAPQPLTVWAADSRSAGVIAWTGGRMRLYDHPRQARLRQRFSAHAQLVKDLEENRGGAYRRTDGSRGGYTSRLTEWKVNMLVLPMEAAEIHRVMYETAWQVVDLDSPSVPYLYADDPASAPWIVQALRQSAFVAAGPWQPTAEIFSGQGWRVDAAEWLGASPDPHPAIRQSRFFRSLKIPIAALRVIRSVQSLNSPSVLWRESARCQDDLAYQEWFQAGAASAFRRRVLARLEEKLPADENRPWALPVSDGESADETTWNDALRSYLSGHLPEARDLLSAGTPQQQYGAAMISLEEGDTDGARERLERLLSENPETTLAILIQDRLNVLETFQALPQ